MDSALACREFCKEKYAARAKYFTWQSEWSVWVEGRGECRCKEVRSGRREKGGMISGNVHCDDEGK